MIILKRTKRDTWRGIRAVSILSSVLVGIGLSSCTSPPDEKLTFKLHLQEGHSYNFEMISEHKISQQVMGRTREVTQLYAFTFTLTVEDIEEDGTAAVAVQYQAVRTSRKEPDSNTEYDSTQPPEEVAERDKPFAALVGQGFRMKMGPDGRIQDIQGVDELLDTLLESLTDSPAAIRAMTQISLEEQFGEAALRETMARLTEMYPDRPVGIGDSWAKSITINKGFPMFRSNTYHLISRQGGTATVEVNSEVAPNQQTTPVRLGGTTLRLSLSGRQTGTIQIDEKTGLPLRAQLSEDLSGNMIMESKAPGGESQSLPVSIKGTRKIQSLNQVHLGPAQK